jgi:hypothetical protein
VSASVTPGTRVALDLNDRGRAVLADSVGPGPVRVEGLVESLRDSTYLLRVSAVRYAGGATTRWSNETLGVPAGLVRTVRERRFSRGRTAFVSGVAAAAVLAFAITRDLFGDGSPTVDRPPPEGPPGGDQ